jgi:hypothetical protein
MAEDGVALAGAVAVEGEETVEMVAGKARRERRTE